VARVNPKQVVYLFPVTFHKTWVPDRAAGIVKQAPPVHTTFCVPLSLTKFATMAHAYVSVENLCTEETTEGFRRHLHGVHKCLVDFAKAGTRSGVDTFSDLVLSETARSWQECAHGDVEGEVVGGRCYSFDVILPCDPKAAGSPFKLVPNFFFNMLMAISCTWGAKPESIEKLFQPVIVHSSAKLSITMEYC
jgi:hypothetical protein